ncbi:Zinc finger homeobox protein 3, partial [Plakobranchus ocellatus]
MEQRELGNEATHRRVLECSDIDSSERRLSASDPSNSSTKISNCTPHLQADSNSTATSTTTTNTNSSSSTSSNHIKDLTKSNLQTSPAGAADLRLRVAAVTNRWPPGHDRGDNTDRSTNNKPGADATDSPNSLPDFLGSCKDTLSLSTTQALPGFSPFTPQENRLQATTLGGGASYEKKQGGEENGLTDTTGKALAAQYTNSASEATSPPLSPPKSTSAGPKPPSSANNPHGCPPCALCPLCRHECGDQLGLRDHLLQQHRVAPDGVPRLLCMVDMPSAATTSSGAATSDSSGAQNDAEALQLSIVLGGEPASSAKSLSGTSEASCAPISLPSTTFSKSPSSDNACKENGKDMDTNKDEARDLSSSNNKDAESFSSNEYKTATSDSQALRKDDINGSIGSNGLALLENGVRSPRQRESSVDVSSQVAEAVPSTSFFIPSSTSIIAQPPPLTSAPPVASTSSSVVSAQVRRDGQQHRSWPANDHGNSLGNSSSKNFLSNEIDLDILQAEHDALLTEEGVDIAVQERLERDFQDLFRCQTCTRCFSNIDQLYSHQNELGHLELKQTPRGPGYLCWRKGCNQYFKTATALQVHFREIHARRSAAGLLTPQELSTYTAPCSQCSHSFRSVDARERHRLFHLMQAITQCKVCPLQVSSAAALKHHLHQVHGDEISSDEMSLQLRTVESSAELLFSSPAYEQFTARMLIVNGKVSPSEKMASNGVAASDDVDKDKRIEHDASDGPKLNSNGIEKGSKENPQCDSRGQDESDGMSVCGPEERQFLDEYLNSQSMAEEHYHDVARTFRCHACRVAFTSQRFLLAHNKTAAHIWQSEKRDSAEESLSRSFRCDICKESFLQKSMLLSHYKSATHIYRLKQLSARPNGDLSTGQQARLPSPLTSSPKPTGCQQQASPSPNSKTAGSNNSNAIDPSPDAKPYKCNICKVSYNNQASIEIHLRSVGHKTRTAKLGELIQAGQVDVQQALVEHPDARTAGRQQAQIIADLIHQQATAQAASNSTTAAYYNLQNINTMAQLSLLQGLLPTTSQLAGSAQSLLNSLSNEQMEAYYAAAIGAQLGQDFMLSLNSKDGFLKEKTLKTTAKTDTSERAANMVIKQDGKIEPASCENRGKAIALDDRLNKSISSGKKDEEQLPANFPHAPIIARPRGYMGRFKPQLHRSLLENFGFECVMHFNEEHTKGEKAKEELECKDDCEVPKVEKEGPKEAQAEPEESETKSSSNITEESVETESDPAEKNGQDEKKDENKENMDLPELKHCTCKTCHKGFSNVWVLKNHEEEVHQNFVAPEFIETFGKKFKEEWEKSLPKMMEPEATPCPQNQAVRESVNSSTAQQVEQTKQHMPSGSASEMPPPPPPNSSQSQGPPGFDMSQLLPLMGMNLLPMHLPLSLMNLGLQNSLMPTIMMPGMDINKGFLPPNLMDPTSSQQQQHHHQQQQQQQQQLHAAANAAAQQSQNQKRVRTRISDDQLKVLRQYFDINNSPSEEQITTMANQTGLPHKVIKHWFRNTLFKERQRNKDSPYNFNNPPSTSIDLDEYDRTGKIPDIKVEPEEDDSRATTPAVLDEKKDDIPVSIVKEEGPSVMDCDIDSEEALEKPPLKIDLTPKAETLEESNKRDSESHSNASSPSNLSSIPSTPTASAPATPTPSPIITANPLGGSTPLTFSLDAYAANMARLEAATFQSIGKRANRTRFTDFQIKTLQDYFERNAYPKDDELEHLSKILNLSARVIVVWFQNARQKARKIYENQPTSAGDGAVSSVNTNTQSPPGAGASAGSSPFQRTPGLNYQCKKCNSVYQRYYELIKHQKNSCPMENYNNNNNKPIPLMGEDDSNFSYSNDDSNFSDVQMVSTPTSNVSVSSAAVSASRERSDSQQKSQEEFVAANSAAKINLPSYTAHMTAANNSSLASSARIRSTSPATASHPSFKCDKCPLTFSRFDMWQEHQKAHSIAPAMFTPFASGSAFGMLQTLAHQDDVKTPTGSLAGLPTAPAPPGSLLPAMVASPATSATSSISPAVTSSSNSHSSALGTAVSNAATPGLNTSSQSPNKRKTDSEDEGGEQPRDKRLRTTILPEQLDYLYQQYQMDCNPSRKQLEHIASTVNLKKRVVQVWFQNTRARERKGHYRAHQQLINKRCPFCRALFRAKSALESHLATKHPEEMAKGDINVDLIPDAMIEPPGISHGGNSSSSIGKHGVLNAHSSASSTRPSIPQDKVSVSGNSNNHGHKPSMSAQASASGAATAHMTHELGKYLPPSIPNYMAFMAGAGGLGLPFPGPPAPEMFGQPSFEDPFFKKYMSELASSMATKQEQKPVSHQHRRDLPSPPTSRAHSPPRREVLHPPTVPAHSGNPSPKPTHQSSSSARPVDAHKPKSSVLPAPHLSSHPSPHNPTVIPSSASSTSSAVDETPLDLSKPTKAPSLADQVPRKPREAAPALAPRPAHHNVHGGPAVSQASLEMEYLRRLGAMDDSFSETQSESADPEFLNDIGSSPASPCPSGSGRQPGRGVGGNCGGVAGGSTTPNTTGKRYRTQMSATQVKVMKHLFQDYKTPTMAECELLGQEIGLAKRVVQVWFQNARAKEKKAKLNASGSSTGGASGGSTSGGAPPGTELDFPKSPEECKLCGYKYSHKVTVQDHIFTKSHIDRVKRFLSASGVHDLDLSPPSQHLIGRPSQHSPAVERRESDRNRKSWEDPALATAHLAQLKAMGINPGNLGFPLPTAGDVKTEKSEAFRKEKKTEGSSSKDDSQKQQHQQQHEQQQAQAALELAMNAQMLSALGGYMPGLDPNYLPYMYGGLPGYFPGVALPMLQPGMMA